MTSVPSTSSTDELNYFFQTNQITAEQYESLKALNNRLLQIESQVAFVAEQDINEDGEHEASETKHKESENSDPSLPNFKRMLNTAILLDKTSKFIASTKRKLSSNKQQQTNDQETSRLRVMLITAKQQAIKQSNLVMEEAKRQIAKLTQPSRNAIGGGVDTDNSTIEDEAPTTGPMGLMKKFSIASSSGPVPSPAYSPRKFRPANFFANNFDGRPAYAQHQMSVEKFTYVVVGFGVAGGYACKELANLGVKDEVAVIGEEPTYAYERPALSKGYLFPPGNPYKPPARLPKFHTCIAEGEVSQGEEWYAAKNYKCFLSHKVVDIHLNSSTIRCANGQLVEYEKLIVCTGSKAKRLTCEGWNLENVFYLRQEAEALNLVKKLESLRYNAVQQNKPNRVVILGAGYLGVEVAASLSCWNANFQITLVHNSDQILSKLPWEEEFRSKVQEEVFKRFVDPVEFIPNCLVRKLIGNAENQITQVILSNGRKIDCQALVCCIGATPYGKELFGNSTKLDISKSFQVNGHNCWLTGELAIPECGVQMTREMAKHVARQAFFNSNQPFKSKFPFHYSRLFEYKEFPLSWYQIGYVRMSSSGKKLVGMKNLPGVTGENGGPFLCLYYDEDPQQDVGQAKVKAAVVCGSNKELDFMDSLRKTIESDNATVDQILRDLEIRGYAL